MQSLPDVGFDENGSRVGVEGFDYDAVEASVAQDLSRYCKTKEAKKDKEEFTAKELEAAIKVIDRLMCWIWANGMKNPEGVKVRAIVVCWAILKPLRVFSLTGIAQCYGKKKQSLGRWVDQFKKDFKFLSPHMRPLSGKPPRYRHTSKLMAALHGAEGLRRAHQDFPAEKWPEDWRVRARETLGPVVQELFCSGCAGERCRLPENPNAEGRMDAGVLRGRLQAWGCGKK